MAVALLVPLAELLKTTILMCASQQAAGYTIVRFCGESDCPDKKLMTKILTRDQAQDEPGTQD